MIKNFFTKFGIIKVEEKDIIMEEQIAFESSKTILKWLKELDRSWARRKISPNCFYSDTLEALYVYENEIKYWEDIRVQDAFKTCPIPDTKLHLEMYLTEPIKVNIEKEKQY